jgi:hypothetical protein
MAIVIKEAASTSDFFYGKPGILAILLKYPFKFQHNFIKCKNLAALIPNLKRNSAVRGIKGFCMFKNRPDYLQHI